MHKQIAEQTGAKNNNKRASHGTKRSVAMEASSQQSGSLCLSLIKRSIVKAIVATKATLMFQPLLKYRLGRVLQWTAVYRSIITKVGVLLYITASSMHHTTPPLSQEAMLKDKRGGAYAVQGCKTLMTMTNHKQEIQEKGYPLGLLCCWTTCS